MKTYLKHQPKAFKLRKPSIANIYIGFKYSIDSYHLLKGTKLMVSVRDNNVDDNEDAEHTIIVSKGEVEIQFNTKKYNLKENESFSIFDPENYHIVGVKSSIIYLVTNSSLENDIDYDKLKELSTLVRQKDHYLLEHDDRVSDLSVLLAGKLIPNYDVSKIAHAATFHDIGKCKIPSKILNKPGKLTPEEFDIIKKHPVYSYDYLKGFYGEEVASIALHHHELLDGSGYPSKLKGDEVTMQERILAVSDVFDALTSDRAYRKGFSKEEAFKMMREQFKDKLDQNVVNTLEELLKEKAT